VAQDFEFNPENLVWLFEDGTPLSVVHPTYGKFNLDREQLCLPIPPSDTMFWALRHTAAGLNYDKIELRALLPSGKSGHSSYLVSWSPIDKEWNYSSLIGRMCYLLWELTHPGKVKESTAVKKKEKKDVGKAADSSV